MDTIQNSKKQLFIDYIPAELRENTEWRIVFYALNPATEKLEIKRIRVQKLKSIAERRKFAKKLVANINARLEKGWNPFYEIKGSKQFVQFNKAVAIFLKEINQEYKDKNLSLDTIKTYTSRIANFKFYLTKIDKSEIICYKINEDFMNDYLDYLRYEKELSSRTRDNYFTFLKTLFEWMKRKKYMVLNPCESIKKIHKKKNDKVVITHEIRKKIFNYYNETNVYFLTFCMCCYYCLVRRTELSKIKVSDVNLKNNTIYISADDSKNNKSAHVTIPPKLAELLEKHLQNSTPTNYLFSNNNYKPGKVKFLPNKATSNWSRMRKKIGINIGIKWYYLKDTGIVDLIIAGVPLNSVRDQARHHSISQTNEYIPRNMKFADEKILKANLTF
jgi:integrase